MNEWLELLIGIFVLILGVPIGDLLRKVVEKDEIKKGQKWFIILVWLGLIGGLAGLVMRNDVLLFSGFFIAIVSSRSLKKK